MRVARPSHRDRARDGVKSVSECVLEALAGATRRDPASLTVQTRPTLPHQANRLHEVWLDGRLLIAKEFLTDEERDGPQNEYRALQLVEPLDVAPRPVFFDPSVGPVVVYAFMEGAMWDRRVPSAMELEALAEVWIQVHALLAEGLWVGRGQAESWSTLVQRLQAPIERYAVWAQSGDVSQREAARLCLRVLDHALTDALPFIPDVAPLCFCRSDARFANVIARPDGRVGLVDWEDSGLRDPARELADLLLHPNQEDLLDSGGWQPFLDRYLPSRTGDEGFGQRLHGYLAIFSVFWLDVLLGHGMQRATAGALAAWTVNGMQPNDRLRRYLARGLAWPAMDPTRELTDLADVAFF